MSILVGNRQRGISFANEISEAAHTSYKDFTLVEKAELYRRQNTNEWETKQRKRKRAHDELLGIFAACSFLDEYHAQQQMLAEEERKEQEELENQPRKIFVQMSFCPNSCKKFLKKRRSTLSRIMGSSNDNQSICQKKNNTEGLNSEMTLSILKGTNLHNHMPDDEAISEKCFLSVALCPDEEFQAMISPPRYITSQGLTRWDHKFLFKGFTPDEFNNKYIKIAVFGQRYSRKFFIGHAVISGRGAMIRVNDGDSRRPSFSEVLLMEKGLASTKLFDSMPVSLLSTDWQEITTPKTKTEDQDLSRTCITEVSDEENEEEQNEFDRSSQSSSDTAASDDGGEADVIEPEADFADQPESKEADPCALNINEELGTEDASQEPSADVVSAARLHRNKALRKNLKLKKSADEVAVEKPANGSADVDLDKDEGDDAVEEM